MTDVTIVGLLPEQAQRIKREYKDLDLRFLASETPIPQLQATTQSSDQVILMTKFIPHKVQKTLRSRDGMLYCTGGLSSLRDMLKTSL